MLKIFRLSFHPWLKTFGRRFRPLSHPSSNSATYGTS